MFDTLLQGLEGQRATETQGILEGASQRGVLRSSMPTDLQTQLGEALLAQRGQLESQRAGQIGEVRSNIAEIGLNRVQSINQLAQALQSGELSERQFRETKRQFNEQLKLQKRELDIQASAVAARGSGGGGSDELGPGDRALSDNVLRKLSSGTPEEIITKIDAAGGTQADLDKAFSISGVKRTRRLEDIRKKKQKQQSDIKKRLGQTSQFGQNFGQALDITKKIGPFPPNPFSLGVNYIRNLFK